MNITPIIGVKKQEQKIEEMGKIAYNLFPKVNLLSYKGAFRFGVVEALKEFDFENWKEVAFEDREIRGNFFESILKFSTSHLKKFKLTDSEINLLKEKLRKNNLKYIQ